jgi:hypothetical protein
MTFSIDFWNHYLSSLFVVQHHVHVVSDIPTELIASFSATLEDALQADLILHVRKVTRLFCITFIFGTNDRKPYSRPVNFGFSVLDTGT